METRLVGNPSGVAVANRQLPLPFDSNIENKLPILLSKK